MALTGQPAQMVYRSALAILSSGRRSLSEGELTDRIIAIHGREAGQSYQAYQAVVRQAVRGHTAAQRVDGSPGSVVPGRDLPVDPTIDPADAAFSYRTLIRVLRNDGSGQVEYATDVHSDQALSYAELLDFANNNFSDWSSRQSTGRQIAALGSDVHVSIEVLSAGRAR